MSRRRFIALAGGSAGMAAFAASGIPTGWASNKPDLDPEKLDKQNHISDVLVIGGGMAGLFASVKAHEAGASVRLVLKGQLGSSGQVPSAKGIFAFDPGVESMSINDFVDQVSLSAMGTNNPVFTRQLAEHSLARITELRKWGFFDSPLSNKSFSKPIKERNIPLMERVHITHLIKENGRIAGAAGFGLDEAKIHIFQAKSVILCTGAGGFKPHGYPISDLTHDGTVMAYNIGAKVTGKEWNDVHPCLTENAAACSDSWQGIIEKKPGGMRQSSNRPKGLPLGMGDPPVDESSLGMAKYKSEGLVPRNNKCESNIPGLFAAGDALGSYITGGYCTQTGAFLAGSAVQGTIAAEAAADYVRAIDIPSISSTKTAEIREEILSPLKRKEGYDPAWVTQTLQSIMIPNFIQYIKKDKLMKASLTYVEELRDQHMPYLRASDLHELRLAHETASMIINAEMKLRASLMRTESRCSHYRLDYPDVDNENWRAWINIYKGIDGQMKLEKQTFDNWPNQITI